MDTEKKEITQEQPADKDLQKGKEKNAKKKKEEEEMVRTKTPIARSLCHLGPMHKISLASPLIAV
jgi:hypothetical protein